MKKGLINHGSVYRDEGLVSVERWSCIRGASCVVYTMGRFRDWSL